MVKNYYVKNMVCDRCIKVISDELGDKNIVLLEIELGRLKLDIDDALEKNVLIPILEDNGFSLIKSPEKQLVEQIKIELIKMLKELPLNMQRNLSTYLEEKINIDYSKISKLFSFNEHITIEKYFIKLKIEKAKELVQTNQQNFTEIGQLLGYSSLTHLSNQFKTETGMSLSNYKANNRTFRRPLDGIL